MALIEAPEQAMRLARAICSDISLYNEEKIVRSIQLDNFFDALRDELSEGRDLFKSRVSSEIFARTNFFDRAVVDVILKPKGRIRSKIW
jgi:O-methyltransferase involved in polyketide biosynthesis